MQPGGLGLFLVQSGGEAGRQAGRPAEALNSRVLWMCCSLPSTQRWLLRCVQQLLQGHGMAAVTLVCAFAVVGPQGSCHHCNLQLCTMLGCSPPAPNICINRTDTQQRQLGAPQ